MFDDRGFYKRAQILASDLALAGVAEFTDLDRLTIFADNLVPHVLRCDGVLVYDEQLAAHIDRGERLTLGGAEREIRACALHACELISQRTGVPSRKVDTWLWTRGQSGGVVLIQVTPPPPLPHRLLLRAPPLAPGRIWPPDRTQRPDLGHRLCIFSGELGHRAFECADATCQPLDRLGNRIWQMDPVRIGALRTAPVDSHRVTRVAHDRGVGRHIGDDHAVGPDLGAVADRDRTEQLGPEPIVTLSCTVGWRLPVAKPVPPSVTP